MKNSTYGSLPLVSMLGLLVFVGCSNQEAETGTARKEETPAPDAGVAKLPVVTNNV